MNCNIIYTKRFEKSLKRLAKHYKSLKVDLEKFVYMLRENPLQGAELGGGARELSVLQLSRLFLLLQEKDATHIALLDIYDKSERETITDKELKSLLQEFE